MSKKGGFTVIGRSDLNPEQRDRLRQEWMKATEGEMPEIDWIEWPPRRNGKTEASTLDHLQRMYNEAREHGRRRQAGMSLRLALFAFALGLAIGGFAGKAHGWEIHEPPDPVLEIHQAAHPAPPFWQRIDRRLWGIWHWFGLKRIAP